MLIFNELQNHVSLFFYLNFKRQNYVKSSVEGVERSFFRFNTEGSFFLLIHSYV